jgi:hypothetical protein
MKMADLKAGTDYLVSGDSRWQTQTYRTSRYRVINTERWADTRGRYSYRPRSEAKTIPVEVDGVTYQAPVRPAATYDRVDSVLAIPVDRDTGKPAKDARATLVPLREVRGEWATTYPEVLARVAEIRRREQEAQNRQRAQGARGQGLVDRVRALGIDWASPGYRLHTGRAEIDLDTLQALVERAERATDD